MIEVTAVHEGSLGEELGLQPGTQLLSVNDRDIYDFLDWEYQTAEPHFVLLARTPAGDMVEYDVERPEGLAMGVELEAPRIRRCANRCDFCFVDGNPTGMRNTLYIRDDDYRLSFRYGNFATLTNLKARDVERIIEYRLSPLYVSVHATDPIVRRRLLRNPHAPAVVPQLARFAAAGIQFHTQIVIQPGLNDGDVLHRTLDELYALGEAVLSVSVVPVGLTTFSKTDLVREPSVAECRDCLAIMDRFAQRARAERGHHWAYGSDDLYLGAQVDLPPAQRYDGFEQVENGVGSVRFLQSKLGGFRANLPDLRIGVVTGTAMGRLMPQILTTLEKTTGGTFSLVVVENDLFGPAVTSAGLLGGRSIARALESRPSLDLALIPAEALNDDGRFLDDTTLEELAVSTSTVVRPSLHFTDALGEAGR